MPDSVLPWTRDQDRADAVVLDARSLRGLAHPLRLRLLGLLRLEGPSTSSRLAQRLGINSGATSYHLRQLADHGFAVEEPDRGTNRERWWRAAHRSTWFDDSTLDADAWPAGEVYLRAVTSAGAEQVQRAIDEKPTLPAAWRSVGALNDYLLRLSPDELARLVEELAEVVGHYRRDLPDRADAPPGTAPVIVQLNAFPRPGVLPVEGST